MWSVSCQPLCDELVIDAHQARLRLARYAHRLRKEGHTKFVEYSLVHKQQMMHKTSGIKRASVRTLHARAALLDSKARGIDHDGDATMDVESSDDSEDDEGAAAATLSNGRHSNGKSHRKRRRSDDAMQIDAEDAEEALESDDEQELGDDNEDAELDPRTARQTERIIPADEVRAHLRLLFNNERSIINLLYAPHGPLAAKATGGASADIFFMDVVAVPPTRFRPAATMGDQVFENPQNALLNGILRQTFVVRDLNMALVAATTKNGTVSTAGEALLDANGKPTGQVVDPARLYVQLLESLIGLQVAVNSMMDSTKNPMVVKQGKLPPQGVKQMLEKKEGLFRKNMMVRTSSLWKITFSSTWC